MKTLILYYTRTGTTKIVAENLKERLGADIEDIECSKYVKGPVGYVLAGKDAMQKKTCKIEELKANVEEYDLVIIGGPIWSWNVCPPARSVCRELKGKVKQVAFFCTMGSDGDIKAFKEMETECGIKPIAKRSFLTKEVSVDNYQSKLEEFVNKLL